MAVEIGECYTVAVDLALKGGKIISNRYGKPGNIETKSSRRDLVTDTDKLVEAIVIGEIRKRFPHHKIFAEESSGTGQYTLTDDPTWIIDPLDGTMNFVHRLPYICISIALYLRKEPLLGVVHNPILDLTYTALKGNGAYLNSKRLKVSGQKSMSNSLIMTEVGFRENPQEALVVRHNLDKIVSMSHGMLCINSAALQICHVAEGGADASVNVCLYPWDKAAGVLIVQEAGGVVVDNTGEPHDLLKGRVLCAATKELAQELVTNLLCYQL